MATSTTTTTKATKATKANNDGKVSGVIMAVVDPKIVDKYLGRYKVAVPKDATIEDRVRLLAQASRTNTNREKLADCDKCKGDSDITLPECPYCGEGGTEEMPMGNEPATTSGKTTTPEKAPEVETAPEPEKAPEVETAPEPVEPVAKSNGKGKKRSEAGKAPKVDPTPEKPEKAAASASKKPSKSNGKGAAAALGDKLGLDVAEAPVEKATSKPEKGSKAAKAPKVDPTPEKPEKAPPSASNATVEEIPEVTGELVVDDNKKITTSADLDDAVRGVHEAKRAAVVSHWVLGNAILATFEGDAWKQRRNDKGAPVYRGFKQFCEAELGMSSGYAYKLMDIAASFSADDVAKIGVAKLGIVLRLPAKERKDLLDEVRDGMPLREVADKVRALANGLPQRDDGQGKRKNVGGGKGKGGTSTTPSTPASVLTTTHKTKRTTIKLLKAGTDKPAKRLADKPIGIEETLNGITIRYTLGTDSQGGLTLIIDRSRA